MSIEQRNTFEKGLNLDSNPLRQPENTYRDAINFVRLSSQGDYYCLTNEKGTQEYCDLPDTYSVIGRVVLESDIILISVKNDLSAAQIGIVDSNGVYTVKLDDVNNELDLDLDHPIDVQARVLINNNRIIYFTDNKNPVRTIDLDNPPTVGKIDKLSSLVPKSNFPTIDSFEVKDSSTSLRCGAYQFAFRYLDDKGNITNISLPSALVSIGQNSTAAGFQYQGGYPDIISGKSITLTINNIDTDYNKLEIIAIYYSGNNNELTTNVTAQIDISTSSITHEYKGNILYNVTSDEVQGITTNYSTAKCIEQKDGRLFISNLKENASVEATLQTIANNITLKYFIDTESVPAYKDGNNTAFKVGYKRGEVYSFAFGVIYKNGAKSFAYHIPAPDTVAGTTGQGTIVTPANTGTKVLGTYKSTLIYPTGQDYPNIAEGYTSDNIRYHVMPTFEQEVPYTITDVNNGTINIIGIEPEFPAGTLTEWDAIKEDIQGIYIVRRSRDTSENTSIFSQGIANYMMDLMTINSDGDESESDTATDGILDFRLYPFSSKYLTKTPFLGGINLKGYFPDKDGTWDGSDEGNDAMQPINQPNAYTYIAGDPDEEAINTLPEDTLVSESYGTDKSTSISQLYKRLLVFYSPETELLTKIESNTFTKIKRIGQFTFIDANTARWQHSEYENESGGGDGESEVQRYPQYWNYYYTSAVDTSLYAEDKINITKNFYIPRNTVIPSSYDTLNINNAKQEEFLLLETDNNDAFTDDEYTYKQYKVQNIDASGGASANDATTTIDQVKNIYELVSDNTSQYGSVSGQEYVLCKYIVYDQSTTPDLDTYDGTEIYGGDTYITRVAFTNKCAIKSKCYMFRSPNSWRYPDLAQGDGFGREYIDFRSVIEFYVESTKNTDLRHSLAGGNTYYRYNTTESTLITNPELVDDTKSYNNQYDFENRLQLFNSKSDITSSVNNNYKTRTIWSDQTILGELRDRYRDIDPNNFYDLPFNTGEIWDSFVFANTFYLHTPKTLWKTFVNAIEQQASTAGQVTLGTGGVFPVNLPPQQMVTQQGGYAGTISQWGGCNTPFGYIFPDSLQGKVFIIAGDGNGGMGLQEISDSGLIRFINDNLSVLDNLYTEYTDNPFKSGDSGILSAYDFELKRWVLVKNHPTDNFTLSYDPVSKQWVSFHTYSPNVLISRDNRLFGIMNSEEDIMFHEHNKGNYGEFYNNDPTNSSISIVGNMGFSTEKVFDALKLVADSESSTKIQGYRGTGDTLEVYNDRQHSGVNNIVWNNTYGYLPQRDEVRSQLLRDGYNIKIPLNSLISDANAIFDSNGNLITANINQDKLFRDRIKGYYCIVKFNFANDDNYKLTLNEIRTIFREYSR
jgi:hypothetical protein